MRILIFISLYILSQLSYSEILPIEYFSEQPVVDLARIPPDGEHIAAIHNVEEGPHLLISRFGKKKFKRLLLLSNPLHQVHKLLWYNNEELIIGIRHKPKPRKSMRTYPGYVHRLYFININDMNLRGLAQKKNHRRDIRKVDFRSYFLLSVMKNDKDHVLIQYYDPREGRMYKDYLRSAFKVNVKTNKHTKQFINDYRVRYWYANSEGIVKVGIQDEKMKSFYSDREYYQTTWYRNSSDEKFQKLYRRKLGTGHPFDIYDSITD